MNYALEDIRLCCVVPGSPGEHMPEALVREASKKVVPSDHTPTTHESKSGLQTCGQDGCSRCKPKHSILHVQMRPVVCTRLVGVDATL